MPKAKPYSGPIDADLAVQVLNATGLKEGELLLGDSLRLAAESLERLVRRASEALEDNEFAKIVAEHLSTKMNRRGAAFLTVTEVGKVILHISYEEAKPVLVPTRQRTVPLMIELKARARELGVDISHLGIKRKIIHAFLEEASAGSAPTKAEPSKPKPARAKPVMKVAQAPVEPEPVQAKPVVKMAQDPVEPEPGPMSAGTDETTVSPLPETPPPRPPIVKSRAQEGPVLVAAPETPNPNGAKSPKIQGEDRKGRSLRQLAQEAKEVDIADLLSSEPPK
jgi:hypothetical protein